MLCFLFLTDFVVSVQLLLLWLHGFYFFHAFRLFCLFFVSCSKLTFQAQVKLTIVSHTAVVGGVA